MAGALEDVGEDVEDDVEEFVEEAVEVPVARMLLTRLAGMRACPSTANCP